MTQNPAAERWRASAAGVGGAPDRLLPIHRMEPIDVAHAVRWICSDEARHVTGSEIVVDAGATL